jgi:hypothetical protein
MGRLDAYVVWQCRLGIHRWDGWTLTTKPMPTGVDLLAELIHGEQV